MPKRRILFIVNPISGHRDKSQFQEKAADVLNGEDFTYEIVFTEQAGHATALAEEAVGVYDIVAAVGGDGTLNEVARGLVGTETALAVIPCGSGNGLARCMNIPLSTDKALHLLAQGHIVRIDTGSVNGRLFLSVAGIGLDAQTALDFAQDPRRGFLTYAHYAVNNYFHPKQETVSITFDEKETLTCSPMLITFANSNQFGYHAVIAPHASLQDGLLDTCILERPPLVTIPDVVAKLMDGRLDKSRYLTERQAAHITVERPAAGVVNIDGEPVMMDAKLDVRIAPQNLKILVP
ncbi:MAG: diacylglycerol kinase family lipid kinase [Bacteroidales bacterium]|nr:diacylglycerol kinase family lipid kinase [Bacteroidales bacterium]